MLSAFRPARCVAGPKTGPGGNACRYFARRPRWLGLPLPGGGWPPAFPQAGWGGQWGAHL